MGKLLAAFLTLVPLPAFAETFDSGPVAHHDFSVEFGARARALFFHGSTAYDEKPAQSSTVRLHGDLNLWQAGAVSAHVRAMVSGFGAELEACRIHGHGSTDIHRELRWNESHFEKDESVSSYIDWNQARLALFWRSPDTRYIQFELDAGARYDRIAIRMEGDSDKLGLVTPEAGGRILLHASARHGDWFDGPPIELDLRARLFTLPGRRASAFGWNFSGGLRIQFGMGFLVQLGYTVESARFHRRDSDQDNRLDLFAHGPFIEGEIRF